MVEKVTGYEFAGDLMLALDELGATTILQISEGIAAACLLWVGFRGFNYLFMIPTRDFSVLPPEDLAAAQRAFAIAQESWHGSMDMAFSLLDVKKTIGAN